MVGGATSGQVVLGSIAKQTEQVRRSKSVKQHPSMASVSAPVSRFLFHEGFFPPYFIDVHLLFVISHGREQKEKCITSSFNKDTNTV